MANTNQNSIKLDASTTATNQDATSIANVIVDLIKESDWYKSITSFIDRFQDFLNEYQEDKEKTKSEQEKTEEEKTEEEKTEEDGVAQEKDGLHAIEASDYNLSDYSASELSAKSVTSEMIMNTEFELSDYQSEKFTADGKRASNELFESDASKRQAIMDMATMNIIEKMSGAADGKYPGTDVTQVVGAMHDLDERLHNAKTAEDKAKIIDEFKNGSERKKAALEAYAVATTQANKMEAIYEESETLDDFQTKVKSECGEAAYVGAGLSTEEEKKAFVEQYKSVSVDDYMKAKGEDSKEFDLNGDSKGMGYSEYSTDYSDEARLMEAKAYMKEIYEDKADDIEQAETLAELKEKCIGEKPSDEDVKKYEENWSKFKEEIEESKDNEESESTGIDNKDKVKEVKESDVLGVQIVDKDYMTISSYSSIDIDKNEKGTLFTSHFFEDGDDITDGSKESHDRDKDGTPNNIMKDKDQSDVAHDLFVVNADAAGFSDDAIKDMSTLIKNLNEANDNNGIDISKKSIDNFIEEMSNGDPKNGTANVKSDCKLLWNSFSDEQKKAFEKLYTKSYEESTEIKNVYNCTDNYGEFLDKLGDQPLTVQYFVGAIDKNEYVSKLNEQKHNERVAMCGAYTTDVGKNVELEAGAD